jgi:cytochrome c556
MKHLNVLITTMVLTCFAFMPAGARAAADLEDLEVTMDIMDDISSVDSSIAMMEGPDGGNIARFEAQASGLNEDVERDVDINEDVSDRGEAGGDEFGDDDEEFEAHADDFGDDSDFDEDHDLDDEDDFEEEEGEDIDDDEYDDDDMGDDDDDLVDDDV